MRNNLPPSRVRQPSEKPGQMLYDSATSIPDRLSIGQPHIESVEERLVASVHSEPVEEQTPKIINYNPDVLTCLANLSNDEVFTPPELVNQMLDLLPRELWQNPDAKFLDPVTKSGVFLREIAKRLNAGLAEHIPDLQTRLNHIFTQQLYGIAITELTSLLARRSVYCTKKANSAYSICTTFNTEQGNILFSPLEHTWRNGKCTYCGASQEVYARDAGLESHAYQFIHTEQPAYLFGKDMKFDVIIGNPPYQLGDGGAGTSATPIYQLFVKQGIKLNPRFLIMITPARWFSGGKGLDDFRKDMLNDSRIREIHDFPDSSAIFPGVQIKGGICYFLWERDQNGFCRVSSYGTEKLASVMERPLLEKGADSFIRYNEAISIVKKLKAVSCESIMPQISSRKPFGLPTTYKGKSQPFDGSIRLYQNGGLGYVAKDVIATNIEIINKFKVLIPRAGSGSDSFPHPILGKPFVVEPNSACTETYIVAGSYDNEIQANNLASYIKTKFFRFMVLLTKSTQDASSKVYKFVPIQNFSESWTDEKLYAKYGLTTEEIAFIESMIRPMVLADE
ncbi:Site-specific DNA-methyltransferase (Adenine-specific) [Candidatus Methylobacter favarea]|uniref:site-specific DNA-methyltransferase (adenine-specific) n=1 Tax=Candidatus Methylobacter favarea TaxID=2707345 RepID=A0A8S0XF85_9GAMM|nr:Eco57I restriction-modification methylase domain-containing protein [Candidatus Methylobacter favarea]CAA9890304.1 Site-specific DNA-methyltransferase (Adenine-specific) [Candidatus Methylobacter favarea]